MRVLNLRRGVALTMVAAVAALAPAGVASAASKGGKRIVKAGAKLSREGSSRFEGTISVDADGSTKQITFSGAFDYESGDGKFSMDLGSLGASGAPGAPSGAIEYLMVDGTVYMSADLFGSLSSSPLLDGKKWLSIDPKDAGVPGSSATGQVDQTNPESTVDALRGVSGDVQDLGKESVRGVQTTHYRALVDLQKAIAKAPKAQRDKVAENLSKLGTADVPMDIWIDGKGLPRKMTMAFDGGAGSTLAGASVSETFEFFDFGANVDVEAPPASEVLDMSELLGRIGQRAAA